MDEETIINPETKKVYLKQQLLGSGAFAKVYLVRDQDVGEGEEEPLKACKIIPKKSSTFSEDELRFDTEAIQAQKLKHPNIAKVLDHFMSPNAYYIIMEHCNDGTIKDLLLQRKDTLIDPEIRFLANPILSAVEYLHIRHKIVHRDLKPNNMLLTNNGPGSYTVKLCDFGIASTFKSWDEPWMDGRLGSPNYVAPEVLKGHLNIYHGPPADVWSIGCFLYALVYGTPPFDAKDPKEILHKATHGRYFFPEPKTKILNAELKETIESCLALTPSERPSAFRVKTTDYFFLSFVPTYVGDIHAGPRDYTQEEEDFKAAAEAEDAKPSRYVRYSPSMNHLLLVGGKEVKVKKISGFFKPSTEK